MKKLIILFLALSFALPSITAACSVLSQTACPSNRGSASIPSNPSSSAGHQASSAGGRHACPWNNEIGRLNINCKPIVNQLSDSQFSLLVQWLMGK